MFDTGTSSHKLVQQSKNNLVNLEDIILENKPQFPFQKISADFQMDSVSENQNITDSMHGISPDTNEPLIIEAEENAELNMNGGAEKRHVQGLELIDSVFGNEQES